MPRVLVTCALQSPHSPLQLTSYLARQAACAMQALREGGADVVFSEASSPTAAAAHMLADKHGLLVLGGADVDPALYGQKVEADTVYGINRVADDYELSLIRTAMRLGLPVWGICRGLQLINIAHGGTLVQDIGTPSIHTANADNSAMVTHKVRLAPHSRLHEVYGTDELTIWSGHHQAIDRLGEGLRISAHACDDLPEAVEAEGQNWIVGVQWHPEDPNATREDLYKLAHAFVQACRAGQAASSSAPGFRK